MTTDVVPDSVFVSVMGQTVLDMVITSVIVYILMGAVEDVCFPAATRSAPSNSAQKVSESLILISEKPQTRDTRKRRYKVA